MISEAAPTLEELAAALQGKEREAAVAAARKLPELGPAAIEPLLGALKSQDDEVVLAAAEALGEVGDERAVRPLLDTLRACYPGRSPRRQRIVGVLAAVLFPITIVLGIVVLIASGGSGLGDLFGNLVNTSTPDKPGRDVDRFGQLISTALGKIAERRPTPELRAALPHLREITADSLQQKKRTRALTRKTARRIDVLTRKLDQIPLAAAAPLPDPTALPRVTTIPEEPEVEQQVRNSG